MKGRTWSPRHAQTSCGIQTVIDLCERIQSLARTRSPAPLYHNSQPGLLMRGSLGPWIDSVDATFSPSVYLSGVKELSDQPSLFPVFTSSHFHEPASTAASDFCSWLLINARLLTAAGRSSYQSNCRSSVSSHQPGCSPSGSVCRAAGGGGGPQGTDLSVCGETSCCPFHQVQIDLPRGDRHLFCSFVITAPWFWMGPLVT